MSTREEFEENLNKIGFSIKGRYPNSWIYKPDNTRTHYRECQIELKCVLEMRTL